MGAPEHLTSGRPARRGVASGGRSSRFPAVAAALLSALLVAAVFTGAFRDGHFGASRKLPNDGPLPPFRFTDEHGRALDDRALVDRVSVLSLFFSHCDGPCPALNTALTRIFREVPRNVPLSILSISIDAERDTPETLAAYESLLVGDDDREQDRWRFLSAPAADIEQFAEHALALGVDRVALVHGTSVVLVDSDLRRRGYYKLLEPGETERLIADITALAKGLVH